ncbi:MAG: hypothetical protein ACU0BC_18365 [Pseudooceanicola nanhaiensis]|uniref:hypothetical protein n=3 Tax=Pseudooceanicola nanhaiensis TaxID=375761 RepID=UPI00351259F2
MTEGDRCDARLLRPGPVSEPVSLQLLLDGMSKQMASILTLTENLERTLGSSLCECHDINSDLIRSLQSADFIRQSVKDIGSILTEISPHLSWIDDKGLPIDRLRKCVDMRMSLDAQSDAPSDDEHQEIWF